MYSFFMDGVRLPVTPGKLDTKINNQNKTVKLLNGGEINLLKVPGLTDIDFDMLIPAVAYPFARYDGGFKPVDYYLTKLEALKVGKKPFQFSVSRLGPAGQLLYDTNIRVSLEEYSLTESADNGMDLSVRIKLKQYKDFGLKKFIVTQVTAGRAAAKTQDANARPAKTPAKTYTVKSGDTLWAICKKQLGDGSKYPAVAKLNGIPNPNRIYPGQVIRFE